MDEWKAVRAEASDSQEISDLYRTVWTAHSEIFPRELMANRMPMADEVREAMGNKEYYVIREGRSIVGVVRVSMDHGACLLDRMVVHPGHRGRGIGKALTERAIEWAREHKAEKIWLDTSPKLKDAMALYEKMGFRECGYFRRHYWGEDIKFYEMVL
jgi:GNAT superfamily N-acetyltransferase